MSRCDGCGAVASEAHIRERIERLELATRFRPLHIQVLLLDAAPPREMNDFFYRPASNPDARSAESVRDFEQLMKAAGIATEPQIAPQAALVDFQRAGFFLAYALECPSEESEISLARVFPTLLKRIEFSYRPKRVALLSAQFLQWVARFQAMGWGDRLILDQGEPFRGEGRGRAAQFGDRLGRALRPGS